MVTSPHVARWTWVGLFTLFIYGTLPWGPEVWREFRRISSWWSDYVAVIGLVVVGCAALGLAARHRRTLSLSSWVSLFAAAAGYTVYLMTVDLTPAEKTHFLSYGLLAFLIYRAMKLHFEGVTVSVATVLLVAAIGLGDEIIQYLLPNRFFEWKDVGLNALSGLLATVPIALLSSDLEARAHLGRRDEGRVSPSS